MSPRTGRPPSDDPKDLSTRIRLSKREREKLEFCYQVFEGRTRAEIMRMGIDLVYNEAVKVHARLKKQKE